MGGVSIANDGLDIDHPGPEIEMMISSSNIKMAARKLSASEMRFVVAKTDFPRKAFGQGIDRFHRSSRPKADRVGTHCADGVEP